MALRGELGGLAQELWLLRPRLAVGYLISAFRRAKERPTAIPGAIPLGRREREFGAGNCADLPFSSSNERPT